MNLVKLTGQNRTTRYGGPWEVGQKREIAAELREPMLCSPGVIHAYRSIEFALLLNPVMSIIPDPVAWSAEGEPVVSDFAKVGCYSLTITEALEIPEWYANEAKRRNVQIMFATICAASVLPIFEQMPVDDDRPHKAIAVALRYLRSEGVDNRDTLCIATGNATYAAEDAAADAIRASDEPAADAAYSAAYAVKAAGYAVRTSGDIATAAAMAAVHADRAAEAEGLAIDFEELARQAVARFAE